MRPTLPSQSLQSGLWGQAWGVLQKQPCILSSAIHVPKKQLPNRGLEGRVQEKRADTMVRPVDIMWIPINSSLSSGPVVS